MLLSTPWAHHGVVKARRVNWAPCAALQMAGCARINARSRADTQKRLSKVTDTSHASTSRLYQSMRATKSTTPWDKRPAVMSVDQT
jgi:hypothetical protein